MRWILIYVPSWQLVISCWRIPFLAKSGAETLGALTDIGGALRNFASLRRSKAFVGGALDNFASLRGSEAFDGGAPSNFASLWGFEAFTGGAFNNFGSVWVIDVFSDGVNSDVASFWGLGAIIGGTETAGSTSIDINMMSSQHNGRTWDSMLSMYLDDDRSQAYDCMISGSCQHQMR